MKLFIFQFRASNLKLNFLLFNSELVTGKWKNNIQTFELVIQSSFKFLKSRVSNSKENLL